MERKFRMSFTFFMFFLLMLPCFFSQPNQAKADLTWKIQNVGSHPLVDSWDASLKLDSNNNPHILYYIISDNSSNYSLAYASLNGSSWNIQTVVTSTNNSEIRFADLALDSLGKPHISYSMHEFSLTSIHDSVNYASWNGSSWNFQKLDSTDNMILICSIAVDSNYNSHVCYSVNDNYLMYASQNGSSWNFQRVYSGGVGCFYPSLALDSNNNPHLSFVDLTANYSYDVKYSSWASSEWITENVDSGFANCLDTHLVLDSNNSPHISYYPTNYSGVGSDLAIEGELKYAQLTGALWTTETIIEPGWASSEHSLALDSYNRPHVAYQFVYSEDFGLNAKQALRYLSWTGSEWISETVDSGGRYPSLAFDNNNNPHISYNDETFYGNLKYATLASTLKPSQSSSPAFSQTPPTSSTADNFLNVYLRLIVAIAVILGMAVIVAIIYRRWAK